MHRPRVRETQCRCSEIVYRIENVSLSVFPTRLARVEVHALQREFSLGVQPERQLHHRPDHVVAPCILVPASRLAMQCLHEYFFHFPQRVFQLGTGGGVKAGVREITRGGVAECDRLESLETDVCIGFDCVLR